MTLSIPTSCATAWAPRFESPDSIVTAKPMRRSAAMASAAVALTGSETAITPCAVLFTTTITAVRPWTARRSASDARPPSSRLRSRAWRSEMTSTMRRSTVPRTPRPSMTANFSTGKGATCRSFAALTTASASGCSERCSTEAAHCRISAGANGVPSARFAVTT